jgi:hypothetical protein
MAQKSGTKVNSVNDSSRRKPETSGKAKAGAESEEVASGKHQPPASVQPVEPEDAYLTGGSRSLQRRVLGLNVQASAGEPHPETKPGQHATGSFTDKKS